VLFYLTHDDDDDDESSKAHEIPQICLQGPVVVLFYLTHGYT
jgi:hypothetical protein